MKTSLQTTLLMLLLATGINAQWAQKADFGGNARYGAAGFSIGDKGYIGTGADGAGSYTKDFWQYDPATNIWAQKADFPGTARRQAIGFSISNKGYLGIGANGFTFFQDMWEYDPATNSWIRIADFPGRGRSAAVAFSIGNKGYVGTGDAHDLKTIYFKDFWEYDPATNTWTRKADFAGTARTYAAAFSIDNKGYVGTGLDENNETRLDFWEYDPATNAWTQRRDVGNTARSGAVGFSIGKKGYIGTGFSTKDFFEYDPLYNTWQRKPAFGGDARNGAVGFSINNKGYIGTGSGLVFFKDMWEYTPEEIACDPPTNLHATNITSTTVALEWTAPSTASGFQIVYRAIGTSSWEIKWRGATSERALLTGLYPDRVYRWKMRSICSIDSSTSAWISGLNFRTAASFALHISPNPVSGNRLFVQITNANTTNAWLTITSLEGQSFVHEELVLSAGTSNKIIDITRLPKGVYMLKIINNKNEQQLIKFSKVN